jgi:molybdopterin converting factor small subunit
VPRGVRLAAALPFLPLPKTDKIGERQFFTLPIATIGDLILRLIEQYDDQLAWLLLTNHGKFRKSVILAVNNEVVDPDVGRCLKDDDEVAILPAISGG